MERVGKRQSWIGAMEVAHVSCAEREVIGKEGGKEILAMYTLRHPVMGEVLSTSIWGVPPACLGSR